MWGAQLQGLGVRQAAAGWPSGHRWPSLPACLPDCRLPTACPSIQPTRPLLPVVQAADLEAQLSASQGEADASREQVQALEAAAAAAAAARAELEAELAAACSATEREQAVSAAAQQQLEAAGEQLATVQAALADAQTDASAAKGLVTAERERAATLEKARSAAVEVRRGVGGGAGCGVGSAAAPAAAWPGSTPSMHAGSHPPLLASTVDAFPARMRVPLAVVRLCFSQRLRTDPCTLHLRLCPSPRRMPAPCWPCSATLSSRWRK